MAVTRKQHSRYRLLRWLLFPLSFRVSEAFDQKLPDKLKCLGGSCQASYASQVSMHHPLPDVQPGIDSGSHRPLHQADRIIEQNLVGAHMEPDRGQTLE